MRRLSGALLVLASVALAPSVVTPVHAQAKRPLRSSDLYLLKDIGVSREEAFREADKAFWRL